MPVENDLTVEEEKLFTEQGAAPLGEGGEPIKEGLEEAQSQEQGGEVSSQQELNQRHEQQQEPKPGELGSRHRADGTFKTKEELEADAATLAAQGQQGGQQQQPQMVPHAALHEARQREQAARQREALAMSRLNALLTQRQEQQQTVEMPDIATDPAGYIMALERRLAQFEQGRQEEAQYRQIDSGLEQDELLFSQQVPDYDQASDYYVQSRARELLQFYPPDQAQLLMTQEARQIAQQAWQRGMSAAQVVYGLAQARGYQPGGGQQQQQMTPQQQQVPQRQKPNGQAQVNAITRAQQQSRSLSGGAGSASPEVLNAEALLQMSDDEFEQHLKLGTKGANERFAALG